MYRAQAQAEDLLQQSSGISDLQHQNHAYQVLMKESQERRSLQTLWMACDSQSRRTFNGHKRLSGEMMPHVASGPEDKHGWKAVHSFLL